MAIWGVASACLSYLSTISHWQDRGLELSHHGDCEPWGLILLSELVVIVTMSSLGVEVCDETGDLFLLLYLANCFSART